MDILTWLYNKLPFGNVKYRLRSGHYPEDVVSWLNSAYEADKVLCYQIVKANGLKGSTHDISVRRCLDFVKRRIEYTSDTIQYKKLEYWATPDETWKSKKGDCEDGAILIYCLARACDVPLDRLFIGAGDVQGGGHAWVMYKSNRFPFVWYFLDWCFYPDMRNIGTRTAYILDKMKILLPKPSKYYSLWFMFNERDSVV